MNHRVQQLQFKYLTSSHALFWKIPPLPQTLNVPPVSCGMHVPSALFSSYHETAVPNKDTLGNLCQTVDWGDINRNREMISREGEIELPQTDRETDRITIIH